ncbi:uncharacterized protein THITE_2057645 [Thermothielavioides terrestris NRRL 8126]|uniref:Uncharacterized protein n=1 Tax=Thermothielavioides terrestris (strain ATCC 38088 / NRRL 8126) TaxID=578455 RepID=G2RCV9_THETT|nr:uncharacterized protein THITE_2057645 [Thermothielavioides terrestris NRRL 8126]AEO69847.1 hypothetical protein THITE_2057645 [Thermothielavioides terrestris NRRL 8126]
MTTTVLIGQAPTNLGPLTTTFTPPAACTVAVGARGGGLVGLLLGGGTSDVAYLGQACTAGSAVDATSCWPSTSKGAQSQKPPLQGWGFYSPGLHCPVGYATACSATGGSGGGSGWPVQFKLRDGETAVGCCPSGYGCANINGQTCTMVATSTTVPTVTCDGNKSGDLAVRTVPDAAASITALSLFAPMIQINWQSSDRPASSTESTRPTATSTSTDNRITASGTHTIGTGADSSAETTLVIDGHPQTSGTAHIVIGAGTPTSTPSLQGDDKAAASDSSGGFSSAAKVAVGVGGAVAVLTLLVCALFYYLRRRKSRREEQELDRLFGTANAKHEMTAAGDFTSSSDIPGWYRGQRLATLTKDPFRDAWGIREPEMPLPPPPPVAREPYFRPYRP